MVYLGSGDYRGLLAEADLTDAVLEKVELIPDLVRTARATLEGAEPDVSVGMHCSSPYACAFINHCWPSDTRYPVQGLGGSKKVLSALVNDGYRDVRDVPAEALANAQHQRINAITLAGDPQLLPGARAFVQSLAYPRYYLDFETIMAAIPIWAGTRPYQALPIQWSVHIEEAPGQIRHEQFLDLSGEPPMRKLAEALIRVLELSGPILMYSAYEKRVINDLAKMFPDLAASLHAMVERLVDLAPVARANYYHPDMLGSWSIKAVLPTMDIAMDYAGLDGIKDGLAASAGYLEAIDAGTAPERVRQLEAELLRYCRFDTEAMVRMVGYFGGGE